jgi:hypothetical protein
MEEGAVRARRENLKLLLEARFGTLPSSLSERIDAMNDQTRLRAAILQVAHISTLDELTL